GPSVGLFSSFRELPLPVGETSEFVQSSRIGWAFGNKARIFGNCWVVFLLLQIEARQDRADGKVLGVGLQPGMQHSLGLRTIICTSVQPEECKRKIVVRRLGTSDLIG